MRHKTGTMLRLIAGNTFPIAIRLIGQVSLKLAAKLLGPRAQCLLEAYIFVLRNGGGVKTHREVTCIWFTEPYSQREIKLMLRPASSDFRVFQQIYEREEYMPVIELLKSSSLSGIDYILDVGANVGCTTMLLKSIFPDAHIVSVEPSEENYNLLTKNIQSNTEGVGGRVQCIKAALWPRQGWLTGDAKFRDGEEWSFRVGQGNDIDTSGIEGITIGALRERFDFPRVDFLKIDIEGGEAAWLQDRLLLQQLLLGVKAVAMEVHPEVISYDDALKALTEAGMTCLRVKGTIFGLRLALAT